MSKSTRKKTVTIAFAFVPGQQPIVNVVQEPGDRNELSGEKHGNDKEGNLSFFDQEEIIKMVQNYVSKNFPTGAGNKRVPILITGVTTIRRSR